DPAELDPKGWRDVLDALPPTGGAVDLAVAVALWRGLAHLATAATGDGLDVPRLPALDPDAVVVGTQQVAVADQMWAQHPGAHPVMVVPTGLLDDVAHLLDLDLASERVDGLVTSHGAPAPVPDAVL